MCGETCAEHVGSTITLAGWVARRRDHGRLVFVDLRDRTGITQLVINPERAPEAAALAGEVRNEFVLQARGEVVARSPETVNPRMDTGEVELAVDSLEIVSRSTPLPFQLDEENVDETLRLRYRWLDLRREKLQRNIRLRAQMVGIIRATWRTRVSSTSRRRSSTSRRPRGHATSSCRAASTRGASSRCPQSPQILKQLTMIAGLRPLLPDRDLLPRRGPPGRPRPGDDAARRRDELPDQEVLFELMERCSRRSGATASARDPDPVAAHDVRRG
jgi:aspartyl-tRNA synthetase